MRPAGGTGTPILARAALLTALLPCRALSPTSFAAQPSYTQSYLAFIKGAQAGNETVTEQWDPQGNFVSTSESEIFLDDGLERKRMAFVTRLVLTKAYAPVSYSYRYTSGSSGDRYEVTVKDGRIIRVLTRNGRASEASLPLEPGVVILDFSVYHQFDYVMRRYDLKKGGRQSFPNFIPLIASELPLAITRLQDSQIEHARGVLPVRTFRVEFVGVWSASLATDRDGRLVRLAVREQDLEVVRKDLIPEAAAPPREPARPAQDLARPRSK